MDTEKMKTLLVIDEKINPSSLEKYITDTIEIIFYSDDLDFLDKLKKFLDRHQFRAKIIEPKKRMSRIAEEERKGYVLFVNRLARMKMGKKTLARRYFSLRFGSLWYYSFVYEKNSISFDAFHQYCFLRFLREKIKRGAYDRIVVSLHDRVLAKSMASSLSHDDIQINTSFSISPGRLKFLIAGLFVDMVKLLLQKLLISRYLGKKNLNPHGEKSLFFIYYPFVERKELDGGYLRSHYFKQFQYQLDRKHCFIGEFLDTPDMSFKDFISKLSSAENRNNHFINVGFIKYKQLLWLFFYSVFQQMKTLPVLLRFKNIKHHGVDMTRPLKAEITQFFWSGKLMRVLINSVLLENIGNQRDIYYIFENFGWERALSYKAHQLDENPRVFAYQHCPFGDNYLHFYCDQDIPGLYLPDKILSIGKAFSNKLISMGWGEEKIEVTIGFRYQYLKRFRGDDDHRKPSLLVLFSIDRRESQLFFRILRKTLSGIKGYVDRILFRTHPVLPKEAFMESVPKDWEEINSIPLPELLRKVKFVIAGQGGAAVEALVMGSVIFQPLSNIKVNMGIFTEHDYENICIFDENRFPTQVSQTNKQKTVVNGHEIFNFTSSYGDLAH
jgi:surface carbohydrate biosynthesis protein (TIGR04326 family)